MGMGFAAVRDVATFLRHETSALNPLAHDGHVSVRRALASGVSQTGRALRDLLYFGFNEDESGRKVFDGMLPIIPGTRRSFTNARFAQPGRNPGPEADQLYPVDQFPFTYEGEHRFAQRAAGWPVAALPGFQHLSAHRGNSIPSTSSGARAAACSSPTRAARRSRCPQKSGPTCWPERRTRTHGMPFSAKDSRCVLPSSPVVAGPAIRALLTALNAWTTAGTAPPASRYPSLKNGTLVAAESVVCVRPAAAISRPTRESTVGGTDRRRASHQRRIPGPVSEGRPRRQCHRRHPFTYRGGAPRNLCGLEPAGRQVRVPRICAITPREWCPFAKTKARTDRGGRSTALARRAISHAHRLCSGRSRGRYEVGRRAIAAGRRCRRGHQGRRHRRMIRHGSLGAVSTNIGSSARSTGERSGKCGHDVAHHGPPTLHDLG